MADGGFVQLRLAGFGQFGVVSNGDGFSIKDVGDISKLQCCRIAVWIYPQHPQNWLRVLFFCHGGHFDVFFDNGCWEYIQTEIQHRQ